MLYVLQCCSPEDCRLGLETVLRRFKEVLVLVLVLVASVLVMNCRSWSRPNPLKRSDVKWLHFEVFSAIQV